MLFALAALAQALVPTTATAETASTTPGECVEVSQGVYYDFTIESFCTPDAVSGEMEVAPPPNPHQG
jgi:hypothetical protein